MHSVAQTRRSLCAGGHGVPRPKATTCTTRPALWLSKPTKLHVFRASFLTGDRIRMPHVDTTYGSYGLQQGAAGTRKGKGDTTAMPSCRSHIRPTNASIPMPFGAILLEQHNNATHVSQALQTHTRTHTLSVGLTTIRSLVRAQGRWFEPWVGQIWRHTGNCASRIFARAITIWVGHGTALWAPANVLQDLKIALANTPSVQPLFVLYCTVY